MAASLYLIPCTLGDTAPSQVLPSYNNEIILSLKYFIVENVRSARRFLKKTLPQIDIDSLTFTEFDEHSKIVDAPKFLEPLRKGFSMGIISEAGCPAIADPGADIVAVAQQEGFSVVPLVGPSSIILSLMASGFNGQKFAFHGYLPIGEPARTNAFHKLESRIYADDETQIFIETPYRNNRIVEEILHCCRATTRLCIASNISCADEFIRTQTIKEWGKKVPDLNKKPTIFLLYK
jgi:16S rRNA (cytidine1402-2'-O)-methyltransferase